MSTFYVIATPIGNLEDITLRAIRILKEADIVLCEDTRVTKRLFERHGISTPMISYHAQSGETKVELILEKIEEGTYGICDLSQEEIPLKRLDAIPYATMTVKTQEKFEKGLI